MKCLLSVITDPTLANHPDQNHRANELTNPHAREVVSLFNASYQIMLQMMTNR